MSICCTVSRLFLSICCNLSICCSIFGPFLSICCSRNATRAAEGGEGGARRRAGTKGWDERGEAPMIKTGYFSVLFRAKPREKRAFPQVAKKLTSANPQKSGSFLSWGKECCFLRRPTQAVTAAAVVAASTRAAMASAVRVLSACRLDSLENAIYKQEFP